ncbi:hypothetical protein AS031_07355 [Pseudarthrobacter enclensis]|uniref:Uncharacterized protein n=1 Tax=Pseudarthrobacter enclensis TaxID=993070 RepID=A0A0V8IT16_9MICC|nr:hypothetical protein AS031_07355 [Pseudarthrobacter enclensis]
MSQGAQRCSTPAGGDTAPGGIRASRRLRPWLPVAALIGLAACSPPADGLPGPPPSPPAPASVEVNQSRDQYGQRAILLVVTNLTDGSMAVDRVTVRSVLYAGGIVGVPRDGVLDLPPHQPKSIPALLPGPDCAATPAKAPAPDALISFSVEGQQPAGREIPATDPFSVLPRTSAELCLAVDVAAAADIVLEQGLEPSADGRTAVVRLVLTPAQGMAADRPGRPLLTVHSVGGTPLLAEDPAKPWPRDVTVHAGGPAVTLPLTVRPARCDPHAVAEDKVGTLLPLTVTAGAHSGVLKVSADAQLRAELYDFVTSACRQP